MKLDKAGSLRGRAQSEKRAKSIPGQGVVIFELGQPAEPPEPLEPALKRNTPDRFRREVAMAGSLNVLVGSILLSAPYVLLQGNSPLTQSDRGVTWQSWQQLLIGCASSFLVVGLLLASFAILFRQRRAAPTE